MEIVAVSEAIFKRLNLKQHRQDLNDHVEIEVWDVTKFRL